MLEELGGDHGTDRMAAAVFGACGAAPIAIEAGQRIRTAGLERASEDVAIGHRRGLAQLAVSDSVSCSCRALAVTFAPLGRG